MNIARLISDIAAAFHRSLIQLSALEATSVWETHKPESGDTIHHARFIVRTLSTSGTSRSCTIVATMFPDGDLFWHAEGIENAHTYSNPIHAIGQAATSR